MIMLYETTNDLIQEERCEADEVRADHAAATAAPVVGTLPAALVVSERAAASLRAYLAEANLHHYRVFHCPYHELYDIERCLEHLGESEARWRPLPALLRDGQPIATMTTYDDAAKLWECGVLRLAKHDVVLGRWYWIEIDNYSRIKVIWLAAAPSEKEFDELRKAVVHHRRTTAASVWQVVRGYASSDGRRFDRAAPSDLLLSDEVRARVERELIGFFNDDVAALYRAMAVPYRRGVLLHGLPGNGKTSLIRHVGFALPRVPAMLLRPAANFDNDDLEEVIRRWTQQAPAILVIEDLNWLLREVNVSTFLNLLDGVDGSVTGGLLLIATSNHPEELDPAINNRPGRFDLVIEIACPDRTMRLMFLQRQLTGISPAALDRVAGETDGLSFAHLQEIVRLSGLRAIHAGRSARADDDVIAAAQTVASTHRHAERGFPAQQELAFGLLPLRDQKKTAKS